MASPLPDNILIEIFSRLPAKSVVRFRSLSKSWNSCLSTPQFVKLHLVRRKNHPQNLMLIRRRPDKEGYEILTVSPPITDDVSSCHALHTRNYPVTVLGSCNGLVLLECYGYGMRLINPATRELGAHRIPSPPTFRYKEYDGKKLTRNLHFRLRTFSGFGYDCSTDDYKIVVGNHYVEDKSDRNSPSRVFLEVYSLKLGVWTSVTSPYVHIGSVFQYGTFVNGYIHWLATDIDEDYPSRILAFSLADEVIHEIPAPPEVHVEISMMFKSSLSVLGGCLCMISAVISDRIGRIGVWVMEEYGSVASWTSYFVNTRKKWDMDIPLCFTENNEIVFINKFDSVVNMYHFEKGTRKEMAVDGHLAVFCGGGTFSESLVSPNQATLLAERKRKRSMRNGNR